jgi:hypothetical protein
MPKPLRRPSSPPSSPLRLARILRLSCLRSTTSDGRRRRFGATSLRSVLRASLALRRSASPRARQPARQRDRHAANPSHSSSAASSCQLVSSTHLWSRKETNKSKGSSSSSSTSSSSSEWQALDGVCKELSTQFRNWRRYAKRAALLCSSDSLKSLSAHSQPLLPTHHPT